MSDAAKRPREKSAKRKQKEREERFFALIDRAQERIGQAMDGEELDLKDLKQITGALKDLKELLFDRDERSGENREEMLIRIEGEAE